jgi:hypothetical protein
MSDEPGNPDDDKPRQRKSPIQGGLMACRIELFLLMLAAVEKVSGLVDHWLS